VGAEDLNEGDLEGGDLAVHEDAGEVQLHLEPHVHVGAVDGRRPPQCEAPVGDLVQTRALRVGELLEPVERKVWGRYMIVWPKKDEEVK
jgi:hypothetical protein